MPNYENGKIYKLTCDKSDKIYIGSTVQSLNERLSKHKNNKNKKNCTSKQLFELGEVKIELIENYPCDTKKELETKERHYIQKYKDIVVNKRILTRTAKEWRKDNKEYVKQKKNEYHKKNKEKILEQKKQYYQANKKIIIEKNKEYKQKNKEQILQQQKQYYLKNKDEISKKMKIKINCPCGGSTTKNDMSKHCKTNKHQNYLKSLKINSINI